MYAPLLVLGSEQDYYNYYVSNYCSEPIIACDGLPIYFDKERFWHAFFKSADRKAKDKSIFDINRAQRINWIRLVLQDKSLPMYAGYDKDKKRVDHSRRVKVVASDMYAVIIRLNRSGNKGFFNTAFIIDSEDILLRMITEELWHPSKMQKGTHVRFS